MKNSIILYPANWLYNAGIIGLLRIIEYGKGNDYIAEMLERDERGLIISPKDFRNENSDFSLWYAQYCLKAYFTYIYDPGSFREVRKKIKKIKSENEKQSAKERLEEISERFKRGVSAICAINSWSLFTAEINELVKNLAKEIMNLLSNVDKSKVTADVEKDVKNIQDNLAAFHFVKKFLGYFYFNKYVINNPKGRDDEFLENFNREYLTRALSSFDLTSGNYTCSFCLRTFNDFSRLTPFCEGDFSSIGVSPQTFKNFFYDGNEYSMLLKCPLCELIILCAFAGFSYKPWIYQTLEQTKWVFVHFPEVKTSWAINNKLRTILDEAYDRTFYISLLGSILEYFKEKSYWVLGNILITEISPVPSKQAKKPKFIYFNLNRPFASLFAQGGELIPKLFKDLNCQFEIARNHQVNLATETLKRFLHQEEIITLSIKYIKKIIENAYHGEVYRVFALNCLDYLYRESVKKGGNVTQEMIKQKFGILKRLQEEGAKAFSLQEIDDRKRKSLALRHLSLVKGARSEDFYNELLRLYIVYDKKVPEEIFGLLTESDIVTFQEKALAYISGFVSPKGEEAKNG